MARRLSDAILLGSFAVDPKAIALTEGEKPRIWTQVGKIGKGFKHAVFGEFDITATMLEEMEKNGNEAAAATQVPLDYNHLSFGAQHPDQAIAAGWYEKFERRDDGKTLWGYARLTPKAASHIQNEEFRYISPLFFPKAADEFGKNIGARLVSAALTIYPFLKGMAAVSLSELHRLGIVQLIDATNLSFDERRARVYAAVYEKYELSSEYTYPEEVFEDFVIVSRGGKKYKLGYKFTDDASVKLGEELKEVVNNYQEVAASERVAATERVTAMSGQNTTPEIEKHPAFVALKEQHDALKGVVDQLVTSTKNQTDAVTALTEQLMSTNANNEVDTLIRSGKLLPAQKEAWVKLYKKDQETFKALSETLQVQVKLNRAQGADSTTPANTGAANDPADEVTAEMETSGKNPVQLMEEKVDAYIAAEHAKGNKTIRQGDAIKAVANANPLLFEHYRAWFVKQGSGNMNNVQ